MQKSKTYPFIEIEGVNFLIKVAYDTDTMHVGVKLVREWKDRIAAQRKKYNKDNPEKRAAQVKKCKQAHKGEIAVQGKKYYAKNRERLAPLRKKWAQANPEKVSAYSMKWREANKDQIAEMTKKDRSEHPKKFAAWYKKWAQANPDKRKVTQNERRTYLSSYKDCKKLNQWFQGCDAHHVEPDVMMHIPPTLHQSVWHSLKTGRGMEEMNRQAFNWLNGVRMESPQTVLEAFI